MSPLGLTLGPPGVYYARAPEAPTFALVRLDIAGFVGVAPRGPVDQPVPVESWSEYRWRFGGYDGPGLLPWAVRAFFAQGGRRALVCRVSPLPRHPDPEALDATARHRLTLTDTTGVAVDLDVRAADEGTWGRNLVVTLRFVVEGRFVAVRQGTRLKAVDDGTSGPAVAGALEEGSLLRVRAADRAPGSGPGELRWVENTTTEVDEATRRIVAVVDQAGADGRVEVEVVTATALVRDTAGDLPRVETFEHLRLQNKHARWVGKVLAEESLLVDPGDSWPDRLRPVDALLEDVVSVKVSDGADRWGAISRDSFFDGGQPVELFPVGGPDEDRDAPYRTGLDAMALVQEVALVSVPDLLWSYVQEPPVQEPWAHRGSSDWEPCRPPEAGLTYAPQSVTSVRLDSHADMDEILERQQRLVAHAERQQRFVALLDVPERLSVRAMARWRARFDSSYAAAYHPWLEIPGNPQPGARTVRQLVPPSAFAAGIIADRERRLGLSFGPANQLAREAVLARDVVDDTTHETLHGLGIDVFRGERDGFRLTAARTLSSDPGYRQLTVRRLMTMLRLMLFRQAQWLVFEPHTPELRDQLRDALVTLLRDLYRNGAFVGDSEDEAFFVRCDESVNPGWSADLGRLVAEVGVAPASPLEYLVVRLAQNTDGSLVVAG
jgi:hypothetical protein